MIKNSSADLGTGSIGKLLFQLSIPAIAAQIINALYSIVDRMYIGHIEKVGDLALTGIGLTFPILMIISAFSVLVGMGGAPCAAIKMGEGDNEGAEKILSNSFVMLVGISILLTIFFFTFKRPLLYLFGASDNTIGFADEYLSVYLIGTIFVQIALGLNPFINTQGFAKISMATVTIGAISNIILDPIFIFGMNMGVKGAALATILSQAISAIWVLRFLYGKKTTLKIKPQYFKLEKKVVMPVLALGLSPFIMQSTESLVNVVLNKSLSIYGGDIAVGSMTIISSLMQIMVMPTMGLSQGAQPIISYNYGAGDMNRVKKAFKLLFLWTMVFAIVLWTLVMVFPEVFVGIFNNNPELTRQTVWGMRIFFAMFFMMGAQSACQQTFLALGRAKISVFLALLRKVILLIPLVLILPPFMGVKGIYIAEPIADAIAAITTTTCFFIFYKKVINIDLNK